MSANPTHSSPWWQRGLAVLVGEAILAAARLWTGVRPLWIGSAPRPVQRVYFANHGSHGDFVMIWATLPAGLRSRVRPVAGQDFWLANALRRFIIQQVFNAVLIDRLSTPGEPSPVDLMLDVLAAGESLILFPEGTRNTTDAPLLPFRSGLYHIGQRNPEVELIPVWVDNTRRMMPKGEWLPLPLICTVSYGAPMKLDPQESKADFLERAARAVLDLRPKESASC